MEFNWLAIFLATLAGFVIGGVWFGPKTFFPIWWKLMGRSEDEQPGSESMFKVFGLTALGSLTQAVVLSVIISISSMALGDLDWFGGLATGALVGVGFSAATTIGHKLFAGMGLRVWLLEVGQDIVSLAAMGAILASLT
jgi:hypothetical protein